MARGDVLRSAPIQTKEWLPTMKSAIIIFPGSNRERDMAMALTAATGRAPALFWHKESELPPVDLIVLPGGFSHGDYLRAGAMAARAPVMTAVRRAAATGAAGRQPDAARRRRP